MDFEKLVEQGIESLLFTAPILGPDMQRFLDQHGEAVRKLAQQALDENVSHIYWVGSGNSQINLLSGKYLLDKFTTIPSDCLTPYEFVWSNPKRLSEKSWVFLASFSGATEDTVVALRHATEKGAKTIVLVNKADSLMGQEADVVIAYESKALYIQPLVAAYLFALEVARLQGVTEVEAIIHDLYQIPELLSRQYQEEKDAAKKLAEKFKDETIFYTLGSGVLYGLAYKFGLTVFMENMRVHGSFMNAVEFRHGPAEMLDREKPSFVVLLGSDESREVVSRVIDLLKSQKVPLIVYDMAKYQGIHPLLAPFVLMIPLQWFAVYSAFMRGITDLDDRVLMGRGIMGKGDGITWP